MTELAIPQLCLVVLIGASGSGKSTFAATHFGPFEVLSSDFCRGLVSDDENDQQATAAAFDVLRFIAGKRLAAGRLTVIDATNVRREDRAELVELAREHDVLPVAVVLDVPEQGAQARNAARTDREFGPHVVRRHRELLRRSLKGLGREGFRTVHVLSGVAEIEAARIVRVPLFNDRRELTGPFDIIGDVHGCRSELEALLGRLGWTIVRDEDGRAVDAVHPDGRTAVFVGDLIDRGPDTAGVLRLVMGMSAAGRALVVSGNHEAKLVRALDGRNVTTSHGLAGTLAQLAAEPEEFRDEVHRWCRDLIAHYVLDGGRLVVAHAGLKEAYHGRASGRVRSFALYGDTTGETDEYGLPVRLPWSQDYRGSALVAYGHVPTPTLEWVNNTLCLDTGCVFGGSLSGLRYPERETVSVPAERVWYEPAKPLAAPLAQRQPDELRINDVQGKRIVEARHRGKITIRAENAAGALELMSRFALAPDQLWYLPPTMSPVRTSDRPGLLEHPEDAFAEYAAWSVPEVVCEEKHMGSRCVIHVHADGQGAMWSRTGRAMLDPAQTGTLLSALASAIGRAGLWDDLDTDRVLLDAEILPWSLKAKGLLRQQYAPVATAARLALPVAVEALERAAARGVDVGELLQRTRRRETNAAAFAQVYRRYTWPTTDDAGGIEIAPFQVLATSRATFEERPHSWHLELADRLADAAGGLVRRTRRLVVDTGSADSCAAGARWWTELTAAGVEGMVVKPAANLTTNAKGLVQPGLKVRGPEYLRLIYGPDYDLPHNLERLRDRKLSHKRALALNEYALGLEALARHVGGEPLWRVHEAVFAIVALESEAVDPRL